MIRRDLIFLGLALLLAGLLMPVTPAAVLLAAAALWLWGELAVVWIYARWKPVEPVRVPVGELPAHVAAYNPRNKMYFWMWRVEPNRSVLGFSSLEVVHEFYNKLALRRDEQLAYVYLYGEKFIIFSSRRYDTGRVRDVEEILREFFVPQRVTPWIGIGRPVDRRIWLSTLWVLLYAAFAGAAALLLLPIWAWIVHNFVKYYRESYMMFTLTHMPHTDTFSLSREMLELAAATDAKTIARMEKWAVAFADRPSVEIKKKFAKIYEGRDTGKRLVRLAEYKELLERVAAFNERPIFLFVYAEDDIPSMDVARDYFATADFWLRRSYVRALTGDLTRFPIFYGGTLLGAQRLVELAKDIFGKPVTVPLDSLPTVHGVIIGPSGMGKSWTVASWLYQLSKYVDVVVIDPHGDYYKWAEKVGAEVVPIPHVLPRDLPEVLRRSMWFRRLIEGKYGRLDGASPEAVLTEEAAALGIRPEYQDFRLGNIVLDLTPLKKDTEAQAFWAVVMMIYLINKLLEEKVEQLKTIIVFDEARLLSQHGTARYSEVLLDMLRDLVFGGRKYGFAVWFIVQLETQLPWDIIRSASVQLFLGGARDYVLPLARTVELDNDDVAYLLSAITPREAALSGRPYAMGILRVKPRDHKYHVKIYLDPELK
ncbi:protein of unknown function DUF87 [Pyrobaculum oguniense TE7]|uniref:Helicase HerA central domain-containing protein n=1 Tax=Pyrobaculum oguniense (strain DSM 13380 / JCM 10595 / TE7) TaxID=698757 RepID=H6Q7Y9_PYROT|nr:protein of unknown function DUF87 [Pyrobaculum oguniense TE7]